MRTRAFVVLAVAALALAGCGNHNLVAKVDVLSYLDASQRVTYVGDLPEGSLPEPVPVVSDMVINLVDGLGAVTAHSVTLSLGGQVTVASGSGSSRLKLYLSDESTPPLATVPVMDVPVTFSSAGPAVISAEAACDEAVAELFTHKSLHLAVVLDDVVVASPGVTSMTVTIGKLEAIVLAGRKAIF